MCTRDGDRSPASRHELPFSNSHARVEGIGAKPDAWRVAPETNVPEQAKAIAFDVDADSLATLQQAFPEWQIETIAGATTGSLERDWNPATASLLVIGVREKLADALGLCRGLRSQVGRAHTSLLFLVPPAQDALVRAALAAGADSCLVLPIHAKDLPRMLTRAQRGNQPGRHTLDLDRPQRRDRWQDEGGEA